MSDERQQTMTCRPVSGFAGSMSSERFLHLKEIALEEGRGRGGRETKTAYGLKASNICYLALYKKGLMASVPDSCHPVFRGTGVLGITQELVRNAGPQTTLDLLSQSLHFHKIPGRIICLLTCKRHKCRS